MLYFSAFGLLALDDTPLVASTYYRFRGNIIDAQLAKSYKKPEERIWKIKDRNGKWRYFTLENFRTSLLRQKLQDTPKDERNMRNNVETTIFQMGFHYANNKTKVATAVLPSTNYGPTQELYGRTSPDCVNIREN